VSEYRIHQEINDLQMTLDTFGVGRRAGGAREGAIVIDDSDQHHHGC